MDSPHHISRRLIAVTPLLLIGGIIAQAILLVAAIVLYVPCLAFPGILNGPYQMITKGMARIFARSIVGRKPKAGMVASELSFRYRTRPYRCLRAGVSLCYNGPMGDYLDWIMGRSVTHPIGGTVDRMQMINHLITEEENANGAYINGNMDRDTWTKSLQEIDDKLSILGIRLAFRPWENTTAGSKF